jgi:FAD/FMN-containing dehydrogenase
VAIPKVPPPPPRSAQIKSVFVEWLTVPFMSTIFVAIIGGSAHTVAIGGYTLGGGHSPISRMYGLAVDNLLEVEMVTADAKFVVTTTKRVSTYCHCMGATTNNSTIHFVKLKSEMLSKHFQ